MQFDAIAVSRAVDIVAEHEAKKTGRHFEWIRRRLRECVRAVEAGSTAAHERDCAMAVFDVAAQLATPTVSALH